MHTNDERPRGGEPATPRPQFREPGAIWKEARQHPTLMRRLRESLDARERGENPVPATELMEYLRRYRAGEF